MRVLILTTNSPFGELSYVRSAVGGAETALRRLAAHLAVKDEVTYLSTARHGLRLSRALSSEDVDGVHVLHLRGPNLPVVNRAARRLHRSAFESVVARVCGEREIDAVVTYATYPDTLAAVRARGKRPGLKVVEWMAGRSWELHLRKHPGDIRLVAEALEGRDVTLFESESLKEYTLGAMANRGLRLGGVCEMVDFGVEVATAHGGESMLGGKPYVFSAGMFKPGSKRQDILLDAISTVMTAVPDVHLVLTGVGELLDLRMQQARKLGIEDRTHFLGLVPRGEMFDWLRGARLFVLASEFEGKPQSVLEAIAAGIPCVVSDIPPIREVLAEEPTLLDACLATNEAGDFAQRIVQLLEESSVREEVLESTRRLGSKIEARTASGLDAIGRILRAGLL